MAEFRGDPRQGEENKESQMGRRKFIKGLIAAAGIGAGVWAGREIKNRTEVKKEKEVDLKMAMVKAETIFYALHSNDQNFQGQENRVGGFDKVELTYKDGDVSVSIKANELDSETKEISIQIGNSLQFHIYLFHAIECKTGTETQFHKISAVEFEQLDGVMEKLIQTNDLNNPPIDPNFQGG